MKYFHILFLSLLILLGLGITGISANPYEKSSFFKLSSTNPTPETNPVGRNFPGVRGGNQLIMYTSSYGSYTGTNEFGSEITVVNGRVVSKSGSNSRIPLNGFVLSGHGKAKQWLNTNTIVGSYIKIEEKDDLIKSTTNANSYTFASEMLIKEADNLINLNAEIMPYNYIDEARNYMAEARVKNDKANHMIKNKIYELSIEQSKEAYNAAEMAYFLAMPSYKETHKGIWVRPKEKTEEEIENTVNKMANAGINTIYLETFFHGYTIYPSNVAKEYGIEAQNPKFSGTDPLKSWIQIAAKKGINVIPWVETFYVGTGTPGPILSVYPDWANIQRCSVYYHQLKPATTENNAFFLDPSNPDARDYVIKLILEMVNDYDVKGINLDYIRYPTSVPEYFPNYLSSTWGYTEYAREEFEDSYKIDPMDLYTDQKKWKLWKKYLQSNVSLMVQETYNSINETGKDVELSAVIFPDIQKASTQKMQNWEEWVKKRYIDALTPIILGSSPEMVEEASKMLLSKTKNKVKVYTGVFGAFNNDTPVTFVNQIEGVSRAKAQGVNIFDAAHLKPEYVKALKYGPFKK